MAKLGDDKIDWYDPLVCVWENQGFLYLVKLFFSFRTCSSRRTRKKQVKTVNKN